MRTRIDRQLCARQDDQGSTGPPSSGLDGVNEGASVVVSDSNCVEPGSPRGSNPLLGAHGAAIRKV
jgi:hypothetical protein